jgi:RNA polymerase sigma-70 factor (ECF subfamily)
LTPSADGAEVVDLRERRAEAPAPRRGAHATLAAAVAAGDDRLRALAYHLLGSRDAMDDVLQEVYVKAYRHLDEFRGESTIATWLYRITYTTCIDHLRREQRTDPMTSEQIEDARPGSAGIDDHLAVRDELHQALATLSPERCAAVLLVLRDGYNYVDAAEILGVPPGTVASRVAHGRRQLAAALSTDTEGGE